MSIATETFIFRLNRVCPGVDGVIFTAKEVYDTVVAKLVRCKDTLAVWQLSREEIENCKSLDALVMETAQILREYFDHGGEVK